MDFCLRKWIWRNGSKDVYKNSCWESWRCGRMHHISNCSVQFGNRLCWLSMDELLTPQVFDFLSPVTQVRWHGLRDFPMTTAHSISDYRWDQQTPQPLSRLTMSSPLVTSQPEWTDVARKCRDSAKFRHIKTCRVRPQFSNASKRKTFLPSNQFWLLPTGCVHSIFSIGAFRII